MKNIKFRAWNKTDKTMGNPFTLQDAIGSRSVHGVDTSEVEYMQFTGLLDKNGKEIYEGDIVKYLRSDGYVPSSIQWNEKLGCITVSSLLRVQFSLQFEYPIDKRISEKLIIIGNIYENPELLK